MSFGAGDIDSVASVMVERGAKVPACFAMEIPSASVMWWDEDDSFGGQREQGCFVIVKGAIEVAVAAELWMEPRGS